MAGTEKRMIDANEFVKNFWKRVHDGEIVTLMDVEHAIINAPTVDAKPAVHGVWLNWRGEPVLPNEFYRWWHCSECDYKMEFDEAITVDQFDSNFCPRCGAKLDGDGNG